MNSSKPIIIIPGDKKSIFFEIFFESLKKKFKSPLIIFTTKKIFKKEMLYFNAKIKFKVVNIKDLNIIKLNNKFLYLVDILNENLKIKVSKNFNNELIKSSFDIALDLIKKNFTYKLLNGPINKKKFLKKKFLGITEFIANRFKEKNYAMLIYNKELSVCPLTTHLPIRLVAKNINQQQIINKAKIINNFYLEKFKYKPKIAVTGLNPHCESNLRINEDEIIISKAINKCFKLGINIKGPMPADTLFIKENRKKFDVILGMYHDQVLGPLKALYEYDAINITMGLPFLRVSPDHGPNEKMINKNLSNPQSLIKALNFLDKN
jgi:4-hydroxy-L-threonine phosphate dehydrogenase PdxA